jgi:hypothetical protein
MPLRWTISHPKRLVVAVAKAEVRPRAMVDFLAALDVAGARPYAKLVFLERLVTWWGASMPQGRYVTPPCFRVSPSVILCAGADFYALRP